MNSKIVLMGAGGHCKSVLSVLKKQNIYEKIVITDQKILQGKEVLSCPVSALDDEIEVLFSAGYRDAFITVGSVGNTLVRRKLYEKARKIGFRMINILADSAVLGEDVILGNGIFVGENAVINAGARIGDGVIINTGAIVEHDCMIDDFAHISPGTVLCGQVLVGKDTHVGARSVVRQGVHIGSRSMIGMGSVVLHPVDDDEVAFGNPCRRRNET